MTKTRRISKTTKLTPRISSISTTEPVSVPFALGLGANLGAPEENLRSALRALRAALGPLVVAPPYLTLPHSPIPQPPFLNTAAVGHTNLPARALLELARQLEILAGRGEGPPLGPRPLDIDLLLYGQLVFDEPDLTVPHPRLSARRFVLAPLADIAPDWRVPPAGVTVAALLSRVGQEGEVEQRRWADPP